MDPAYFVGRAEILEWINATLQLKLTKVEETCTGAVACQIVDSLFPGVVQMNKVNWAAKSDWEYVANYKVLQAAFAQLKIDRYVDVDKLIKGKYQDNFEFCQWLKKFAANNETGAPYDALARRGLGKGASAIASRRTTLAQPPQSKAVAVKAPPRSVGAAVETRRVETSKPTAPVVSAPAPSNAGETKENTQAVVELRSVNFALQQKILALEAELAIARQARERLVVVENERDFYFEKLRDVELLIAGSEHEGLGKAVAQVLFANDDGEEALENFADSRVDDAVEA